MGLLESQKVTINVCPGIQESSIIPILLSSLSATELCLMFLIERDKTNQQNIIYRSRTCDLVVNDGSCCIACNALFDNLNHFHSIHMKKPCELFHKESSSPVQNKNIRTNDFGNITLTLFKDTEAEKKVDDKETNFRNCEECGELFSDKRALARHSKFEHEKLELEDNENGQQEIGHIEESVDSVVHDKVILDEVLRNDKSIKMEQSSELNKYTCKYCGELFEKQSRLYSHRRRVHSDLIKGQKAENGEVRMDKKSQCLLCPEKLKSVSVNKHLITMHFHEKENPKYQEMEESIKKICSECGKDFVTAQKYRRHFYEEHGKSVKEKEHLCNICGTSYVTKFNLSTHMDTEHQTFQRYCVECDKTFHRKPSFVSHLKEYHRPKIECTECGKKFSEKKLVRHMKVMHVKDKEFPCKECPKQFAFQKELKSHIQSVHLNLKPYGCENCIYKASSSFNLNLHRNSE